MAYRLKFSDYSTTAPAEPPTPTPTPPPDGSGYHIAYSDYVNNASGPPDTPNMVGPPGPQGIPGPPGADSTVPGPPGPKGDKGDTGASGATLLPTLNYVDNSGFSVNQRGYASGAALAAGIYGFDRWKAGAGGATLTFTATAPSTVVTITAGTLQQVVEGTSVAGGNYMLSWTGTAQGRVGGGAYAASPVAVTGIVAGANMTIEFNTGTVARVKLEAGTTATPWFANAAAEEMARCQRFFSTGSIQLNAYNTSGGTCGYIGNFPAIMRIAPAVSPTSTGGANFTAFAFAAVSQQCWLVTFNASATGAVAWAGGYTASADL